MEERGVGGRHAGETAGVGGTVHGREPSCEVDLARRAADADTPDRSARWLGQPVAVDDAGGRVHADRTIDGERRSTVGRGRERSDGVEVTVGFEAKVTNDRRSSVEPGVPAGPHIARRRIDLLQGADRRAIPFAHLATDDETAVGCGLECRDGATDVGAPPGQELAVAGIEGSEERLAIGLGPVGGVEELAADDHHAADRFGGPAEVGPPVDVVGRALGLEPPRGLLWSHHLGGRRSRRCREHGRTESKTEKEDPNQTHPLIVARRRIGSQSERAAAYGPNGL